MSNRYRNGMPRVNCEGCDARIEAWCIHCPECGAHQEGLDNSDTDCSDCGRSISLDFHFCPFCGAEGAAEYEGGEIRAPGFQMDSECENPSCGAPIDSYAHHCGICGQQQLHEDKFDESCDCCGVGCDPSWEFCAWCGAESMMAQNENELKKAS